MYIDEYKSILDYSNIDCSIHLLITTIHSASKGHRVICILSHLVYRDEYKSILDYSNIDCSSKREERMGKKRAEKRGWRTENLNRKRKEETEGGTKQNFSSQL